jgi:hypothetical protein
MYKKLALLLVITFGFIATSFAQTDKEDRQEKREETKAKIKDRTDYNLFHRQMLSLKEFGDERRKIPALQKSNKAVIKVKAVVDSSDDDSQSKILTGNIVQIIGDNSINVYDVTFDRATKKIVSVKHTPEAIEADKEDKADAAEKTTDPKKAIHKKAKTDDDEDDDEKPVKEKDDDKD